jgi:hypothetical protein
MTPEPLGHYENREFWKITPDLVRVKASPVLSYSDCCRECMEAAVVEDQQPEIIRGSVQQAISNEDVMGDCFGSQNNSVDTFGRIKFKWTTNTVSGGACDGRIDTIRKRIFCDYNTHTGYGTNYGFSDVELYVKVVGGETKVGFDIPFRWRIYTGHAQQIDQVDAFSDISLPDKKFYDYTYSGSAIKTHQIPLDDEMLYPDENTEVLLAMWNDIADNSSEQGGLTVEKFFPSLYYTVELKYMEPFWLMGA